jgi:hypothetical protein
MALMRSVLADSKTGAEALPQEVPITPSATHSGTAAVDPYLSKWIFDLRLSTAADSESGNISIGGGSVDYEQYFWSLGFQNLEDVASTLMPLHDTHPELIGAIFHKLNSVDQRKVVSAVSKLTNSGAQAKLNSNTKPSAPNSEQPAKSSWSLW